LPQLVQQGAAAAHLRDGIRDLRDLPGHLSGPRLALLSPARPG
jgi:hypothetical protein